jgi:hypothetical protein
MLRKLAQKIATGTRGGFQQSHAFLRAYHAVGFFGVHVARFHKIRVSGRRAGLIA